MDRNCESTPHSSQDAAFFVLMRRLAWIPVLLLGLVLIQTSCRRERRLGPPKAVPVAGDGTLRLRALTFNVRYENDNDSGTRAWRNRIIGSVRMIREERPDVFGIQEAMHGQVADMWASLTDYEFHGTGRDDGLRGGEYTGIFFRRDRFEADPVNRGAFWLSDTPERPGSSTWGNTFPRMVVWLRLIDRSSQRAFTVYNTHWDHMHQESRMKSARLLRRHIESRTRNGEPVVVLGDFNARENNPAMQTLVEGNAGGRPFLLDTFHALHSEEKRRTTLHFWRDTRDGSLKVDHILVTPGARILSASIRDGDRPMVSDHFPVIAEFEFPL